MICACGHSMDWHGDRAIGGCWLEGSEFPKIASAYAVLDNVPRPCPNRCRGFIADSFERRWLRDRRAARSAPLAA